MSPEFPNAKVCNYNSSFQHPNGFQRCPNGFEEHKMVKIQSWVLKNVRNLVRDHGYPAGVDGIPPRRPYSSQPPPNWNIVNLVIWDGFGAGLGTISHQPLYFGLSYLGRQMESDKKPDTWE